MTHTHIRYRRLRKAGARWHGKHDCKSVSIVRFIRDDGSVSYRWHLSSRHISQETEGNCPNSDRAARGRETRKNRKTLNHKM